mgnify:CR=1 FL=1
MLRLTHKSIDTKYFFTIKEAKQYAAYLCLKNYSIDQIHTQRPKYSAKKTREYMREFYPGFRFFKASQTWKGKKYPYGIASYDVEGEMDFYFEHTKEVKK